MIKYKLICKNINFNSLGDKVVFFEWANKIDCIDKILELPDELCFFVKDVMDKDDLKELLILFYRYNLDVSLLSQFFTKKGAQLLLEDPDKFCEQVIGWHTKVWKKQLEERAGKHLVCEELMFGSYNDADAFFEWIQKTDCIEKFEGANIYLYLYLKDRELTYDDIRELAALFSRYKIDMKQLAKFVNKENQDAIELWKKEIFSS